MKTAVVVVTVVYQCMISQYSPGVMREVVYNRQEARALPYALPAVDGFVAVRDCERIGAIVWLKPEGGRWEQFLAVDCAHNDEVRAWMDGRNLWETPIAAEVDYPTAVRWKTVGEMQRGYVVVAEGRFTSFSEASLPYAMEAACRSVQLDHVASRDAPTWCVGAIVDSAMSTSRRSGSDRMPGVGAVQSAAMGQSGERSGTDTCRAIPCASGAGARRRR